MLLGHWTREEYNALPDRRQLGDNSPELGKIYRDSWDESRLLKAIYWPTSDAGGVNYCWEYYSYRLLAGEIVLPYGGECTLGLPK